MTSDRNKLIGLAYASMTQHGLVLSLLGPVLPAIMEGFHIQESAAGVMFGLGALGFALGPIVAGPVTDRVGVKGRSPTLDGAELYSASPRPHRGPAGGVQLRQIREGTPPVRNRCASPASSRT